VLSTDIVFAVCERAEREKAGGREGAKESGGESLSRRDGAGREWAKGAEGL